MAVSSPPPAPVTAAPPSSPILAAADSGINPQTAEVSIPLSVSEASSAAYNELIGVPDSIAPYEISAQPGKKHFPGERPLSSHFMMSSCSDKAYVPTPLNTPRTSTGRESHLSEASPAREEAKPAIKKVAPSLRGDDMNEKVYLRGGGPKKRRGGAAGGTPKKAKQDKYSDVDQLLSDFKSPIFKADANIKAVLAHPLAKQTMIDQGESYPFDEMTSEEVATTAADFKLDGTYGRLDSDWMAQAMEASQTRAAGGYDAYLASQFEEHWAEEDEEVSGEEIKEDDNLMERKGNKKN